MIHLSHKTETTDYIGLDTNIHWRIPLNYKEVVMESQYADQRKSAVDRKYVCGDQPHL